VKKLTKIYFFLRHEKNFISTLFIFLFFILGAGPTQPTWAGLDPANSVEPVTRLGGRRTHACNEL